MDTAMWSQGNGMGMVNAMAEFAPASGTIIPTATATAAGARPVQAATAERKPRPPHKEQALHCPRCNSGNTKFCYYNNYSLTQPRHFCKTCRRYWTEGGSLRNVPVGGGSRKKNKPSLSSAPAAPSTTAVKKSTSTPPVVDLIPPFGGEEVDLKLAFHGIPEYNCAARGFMPFQQIPPTSMTSEFPTGFELMQGLRPPTLNLPFNLVATGSSTSSWYGNLAGVDDQACTSTGGKLLFPFENLKPVAAAPSSNIAGEQFDQQNKRQVGDDHPGFWNGINIGRGSW